MLVKLKTLTSSQLMAGSSAGKAKTPHQPGK
jgi:hypothetical protein